MTPKNCLNCQKELTGNYCSGCGQKADTHRISFANFIFHDLLHGTFHIERGMVFTARQALFRPGKAALDYIAGKRKSYYNVFYLILLTIGVMLFIRHIDEWFNSGEALSDKVYLNEASRKLDEIFSHDSKFIMLLFLPFAAWNSFILFRKKKLNLSEHMIISGMILLGILLISTLGNIIFHINMITRFSDMVLSLLVTAAIFVYIAYAYINAFGSDYSKIGIAFRILLFFLLIFLEIVIVVYALVGFVTHWRFDTPVNIAPFG